MNRRSAQLPVFLLGVLAASLVARAETLPREGHLAEVNGLELYYEVHGDGAPLVMLHAFGGSGASWSLRGRAGFGCATSPASRRPGRTPGTSRRTRAYRAPSRSLW